MRSLLLRIFVWFWLAMAVVFGLVSIGLAWKNDQDTPGEQQSQAASQHRGAQRPVPMMAKAHQEMFLKMPCCD